MIPTVDSRTPVTEGSTDAWTTYGPERLIDHVVATHHARLRATMPHLNACLDRLVAVHGARRPELGDVQQSCLELCAALESHLHDEEHTHFALIRRAARADRGMLDGPSAGSVRVSYPLSAPITVMTLEHERVLALLRAARAAAARCEMPEDPRYRQSELDDALAELEQELRIVVHKENDRLFPMALWLVAETDELL